MKILRLIKKRWYVFLTVLIIVIFAYRQLVVLPGKKTQEKAYKVSRQNLKEVLSLSGEVAAEEQVTLRFQTSGRLAWVGVKEGDYVKKYQVIASLDRRDLKNRLDKYLHDYAKERNDFDEAKKVTYPSGAVSDTIKRILENNQYDLDKTVLDVEYQNLAVEYSNLWSPIEGIVTRVDSPFAGVNITPTQAEFEIVNPKTIYFSLTAEQTDVVNIKEGMKAEIIFDAYPDKKFNGSVSYISFSPKTGKSSTVYEVRLKLDDRALKLPLKLQMTGDADFVIREKNNILAVPLIFVKKDKKGGYIMVGKNNLREKVYIKLGEEIDDKVEVVDGIQAGDLIYD